MLLEAIGTARDLGRMREIVQVFVKHGLGALLHRMGLAGALRRAGVALHVVRSPSPAPSPQERVRRAFEELGPTFMKLGQLLAGRSDLLPPEWTSELAKLREHAAAVPWDEIRAQLREDLEAEPETLFDALEQTPIAAASIAQVHRARLRDGTPVVLKIRRPHIAAVVETDLRLMARLAEIAEHEVVELRRWRLRGIVRQFASSLRNELDLSVEARVSGTIARDIERHRDIVVPRVHAQFTRPRLCVQDYVAGQSLDAWLAGGRAGSSEGQRIAQSGARIVLEMVFVHGLYHADPHGGNVLLLADGRLALLDFGMIGRLSASRRAEFFDFLTAVSARREERVVDILLDWSGASEVDETLLAADVAAFLDRYHGSTLREIDLGRLLHDVAALLRDNELTLPVDVAMLLKLFITLEDLGRSLDPGFKMAAEVEAFAASAMDEAKSPLGMLRRGLQGVERVAAALPHELRPLLARLRRGRFRIELELSRLDRFSRDIERSVNRLTIGLVTSALIVGTSVALTVPGGARVWGFPAFALLGFVSSLVLGLGLLVAIVRSGHK